MNRDNITKTKVIVWFILAVLWIAVTVLQFITGKNMTTAILYCAAAVAITGAAVTSYLRYRRAQNLKDTDNQTEKPEEK